MAVGAWQLYDYSIMDIYLGVQDFVNDEYRIILTNGIFNSSDTGKSAITQIGQANGYTTDGLAVTTNATKIGSDADVLISCGTAKWLASGTLEAESAVLFNYTKDRLVAFVELNSSNLYSVPDGEYFVVDGSKNGIVTIDYTS